MNIVHPWGLIEMTDRSAALFDNRAPLRALAFSPVAGRDGLPALQAVLQSAASKFGGKDFSFLNEYAEIRLYTDYVLRSTIFRDGQRFGLITSGALAEQAESVFSSLGIPHDLLYIVPAGTSLVSASIRKAVNGFLYLGAKSIAVCLDLDESSRNREEELRNIVHFSYPSHFLGSVPVLLPPERPWQAEERLESVVVNGYVRAGLARQFRDIMNTLRQYGFGGRLTSFGGNGQPMPVSQCDPWNLIAYEFSRFESVLKQWIEEESVAKGLAVNLNFDFCETAIIGNYRIVSNGCSVRNRILLPAVSPFGRSDGGWERGFQDEDGNRQLKQWVNQLASEVRKRAGAGGLQLLSNTPLFLSGPAGGLAGCELADALGIKAFRLFLGRAVASPPQSVEGTKDQAVMEGPCRLLGYESECRVPPGWTVQHHSNSHIAILRRLR